MKFPEWPKFLVRDEQRSPVVLGRFRVWQWVVLWLLVGVGLLLLPRALMRAISPIVVSEFCVIGAFGISVGWWKTILLLATPIPMLLGLGIYAINVFVKTKNLHEYPPTGTRPLVDVQLRQGKAVRRYAMQHLVSGVGAMLFAVMATYFLADMTAEYGLADASNVAQSSRR
jgi:hypothetical protein